MMQKFVLASRSHYFRHPSLSFGASHTSGGAKDRGDALSIPNPTVASPFLFARDPKRESASKLTVSRSPYNHNVDSTLSTPPLPRPTHTLMTVNDIVLNCSIKALKYPPK